MSLNIEVHQNEWKQRAKELSKHCIFDKLEKTELYDLTWRTTTEFIINESSE